MLRRILYLVTNKKEQTVSYCEQMFFFMRNNNNNNETRIYNLFKKRGELYLKKVYTKQITLNDTPYL